MAELATTAALPQKRLDFPSRRKLNLRRPGPITALDVDGDVLRIAQSAPRGTGTAITRIETGQLDLEKNANRADPEVLGKAIGAVLDDLRLKPGQVIMGVPRHLVVVRNLTLPKIEDVRELASIVHMQVARDLPFGQDESVIDFTVRPGLTQASTPAKNGETPADAPQAGAATVEALVAIVRQETVELYQRAAAAAKLKLVGLGWLSQANARWIQACRIARPEEAVALVSLRPDEVAIDVVAKDSLVFSRGASIRIAPAAETGVSQPPEGETVEGATDFAEAVTIEVVRTLHNYSGTEQGTPVSKLVIAGATGQEARVLECLQKRLELPCDLLPPPTTLELPQGGRQHIGGAIGALGLALGVNDSAGLCVDFLAPKRPAVQRNTKRIRTLALSAAGVLVLFGLFGFRSHLLHQRMAVSAALQKELAAGEKQMPVFRRMQQQAATLQNWSKEARDWLEQYAYLSAVLPGSEDLYITSLSVSGQGTIHLAVQARSGEILANLDRQLRAAGYQVKPLAITPGSDRNGYNFRSTVELLVPTKMKIDLEKVPVPARPADDAPVETRRHGKGGRS